MAADRPGRRFGAGGIRAVTDGPRQLGLTVGHTRGIAHRLAYTEWGDPAGESLVVCAHGLSRSGRDFDRLACVLADDRRVICPDYPGRGASDRLDDPALYHNGTYTEDSLELLAALEFRQLDWIGTSMGGLIGMAIAAHPQTPIRRLVVNDVGPFVPHEALAQIARYLGEHPRFATTDDAKDYFRTVYAGFGPLTDADVEHMVRHQVVAAPGGDGYVLHYDPEVVDRFVEAVSGDVDLWEMWTAIEVPILILRGEHSPLLDLQTARRMMERRAPTRFVEIAGCAHAPSLMTPDQIAIVVDWLNAEIDD